MRPQTAFFVQCFSIIPTMSRLITTAIATFLFCQLTAQSFPRVSVPFRTADGQLLHNALAGGLNNPQISEADLNNDGITDLFVFDRKGGVALPFLHDGVAGSVNYTYAPEFAANFPTIEGWALLRDFNGDGIADLFAYSDVPGIDGIMVHRGYFDAQNRLAFQRLMFNNSYRLIYFPLANGSTTQLYVSRIDIPDITDVDGDGDLDILTFGVAGGYMEYYANRSLEMGLGRDTVVYRLVSNCWGGFYESGVTEQIDLAPNSGQCYNPFHDGEGEGVEFRHTGSTILAFDADGDGDKDLVLGDISFNNLNFLTNGGTPQTAWMTAQDIAFPSNDVPVNLPLFPAAFMVDVDHDGKKDMLVAPNASIASEDYNALWWYRNTQGLPHRFERQQTDFLIETMLDFGTGAYPAFADVNGDGLTDLVVGNNSYYREFGAKESRLHLFLNTGTLEAPAFQLADDNWLNMRTIAASTFNLAPAFGDLDGDGDTDLLVGTDLGKLYFFRNLAGSSMPVQFDAVQFPYMNINVGTASTPCMADLNRDGLMDILVGERNGNINFFVNTGSGGEPDFVGEPDLEPNVFFLGRVDTRITGAFPNGYSAPSAVWDGQEYILFTGTSQGRIEAYSVIQSDFTSMFPVISETWGNIHTGTQSRMAFADLDNDGLLELAVGNDRGGLQFFQTPLPALAPNAVQQEPDAASSVKVFPNPTRNILFFSRVNAGAEEVEISFFNAEGRLMRQSRRSGAHWQEDLGDWPAGMYVWRVAGPDGVVSGKVMKTAE